MAENFENIQIEYVQSKPFKPEHDDESNVKKYGFEVLFQNFYGRRKNVASLIPHNSII